MFIGGPLWSRSPGGRMSGGIGGRGPMGTRTPEQIDVGEKLVVTDRYLLVYVPFYKETKQQKTPPICYTNSFI